MKLRKLSSLLFYLLLGGCASQYGPSALTGGYTDKAIDKSTYLIRYETSQITGILASYEQIAPLWDQRAAELCGSNDFYKEVKQIRINGNGKVSNYGAPALSGVAYCNNKFMDTRQQSPEENFARYINLPYEALTYKEFSPLWELLTDRKYKELQEEVDRLYASYKANTITEAQLSVILDTFSRINPSAEEFLTEWVKRYPQSYLAFYSRALFYYNYAWFKRGSGWSKDLTEEQLAGLKKYRDLSKKDFEKALVLNEDLCIAYDLQLKALMSYKGADMKLAYDNAKDHCPKSFNIRATYLKSLQPRWGGSKEQMERFVNGSVVDDEKFKQLRSLLLTEEGDQFLFKKQYNEALDKYDEALTFGEFSYTYNQRAYVLEKLDRYVDSIKSYENATNHNPYYNNAFEGLTRVLLKQNNLVGALVASSYLTAMNNQDAYNYEREGDIFYHMRRYHDALVSYKKAAILSSDKAIHRHKIRMTEFQIEVRRGEGDKPVEKIAI